MGKKLTRSIELLKGKFHKRHLNAFHLKGFANNVSVFTPTSFCFHKIHENFMFKQEIHWVGLMSDRDRRPEKNKKVVTVKKSLSRSIDNVAVGESENIV